MDKHQSVHHRKPRSIGGTSTASNMMWCSRNKHRAYHTLFQNWEVPRIVEELNHWIDPQWEVIARRRE